MNDITAFIKNELLYHGADLVGFGDLSEITPEARYNLPVGICVAVRFPAEVIRGISDLPTQEYADWYNRLNEKLDILVSLGAKALQMYGFTAIAMTRERVGTGEKSDSKPLPHKTVATRAGIGWIGKSALLVTEQFGSMIRISSILTDAPLKTAKPVNESKCPDNCMICKKACPGGAVSGKQWNVKVHRDEFFDAVKCRKTARERAKQGFGGENITICGKCIEVCPFTIKAWK